MNHRRSCLRPYVNQVENCSVGKDKPFYPISPNINWRHVLVAVTYSGRISVIAVNLVDPVAWISVLISRDTWTQISDTIGATRKSRKRKGVINVCQLSCSQDLKHFYCSPSWDFASFFIIENLKLVIVCMSKELPCNSALIAVDDPVVIPAPGFEAVTTPWRNMSNNVHLECSVTKISSHHHDLTALFSCFTQYSSLNSTKY